MDKKSVINQMSKGQFATFLEHDYSGQILDLLDHEGLEILDSSPLREDRIAYILSFSNYKDVLFQNDEFLDVFYKTDLSYYYACLKNLRDDTYEIMVEKYLKLNQEPGSFANFLSYFNEDFLLKKLDDWPYGNDVLYEIFNRGSVIICSKILNKYDINLSDSRINIETLAASAKESVLIAQERRNTVNKIIPSIEIPVHMMNEKLAEKLWSNYDIFRIRKIINDLVYSTDPQVVNEYIKNKEQMVINSYSEETFNSPFKELYETYCNMQESYLNEEDSYYDFKRTYSRLISKYKLDNIYEEIENKYKEGNLSSVYDYLKMLSDRQLSNYIIDFHFEENYHNIIIDVRELLRFYYDGNVALDQEHVELYTKISNIDHLSIEEKRQLHETLKSINVKEIFYDDMAMARYMVRESIKEYSLTRESIIKYRNDDLSQKYGVDVYVMNDEPFFGVVKTGKHNLDVLPTGHSYSLVGNDCVAIYGGYEPNTFLYDAEDLNPEQIVHVFPYDSFTLFKPFSTVDTATSRVNMLMMPEEITGLSAYSYSELLILERGSSDTDIDEKIPKLRRIALYCIDEITEKDVKVAEEQGLGIILVNSKKYFQNNEYYEEKYKQVAESHGFDYNYFNGINDKDKFEANR